MRPMIQILLPVSLFFLLFAPIFSNAASDCSGPWQTLNNRDGQSPCIALGLDSNRGVCRPGDAYETLCDDIKGGKYRICQGPRRCSSPRDNRPQPDCSHWDFDYNRPCPEGFRNNDCRGGCDAPRQQNNCTTWDYTYNQPCPPGFINRDCRGGCERR